MSTSARYEPRIDNADGKVVGTPLVNVLYLKKNAEVILVHNTDVIDSLNKGAKGTVLDFVRNENEVVHIVVQFENEEAGKILRLNQSDTFFCLYENGTPIAKLSFFI